MNSFTRLISVLIAAGCFAAPAHAQVTIDNDLPVTDIGYWEVRILSGGESRDAWLTALGTPSGATFEREEVVFNLYSYVDVGDGGFQLSSTNDVSGPALVNDGPGPDVVTSSGWFPGDAGQRIDWTATSSIDDGSLGITNTFEFTASPGELLGQLRLYQYLDEDVLDHRDDVFFTRGSAAGGDLELFTVDDAEAIGISHGGGLDVSQGLVNATFLGWAACTYNAQKPAIVAGIQTVSLAGDICTELNDAAFFHPVVGDAFGPRDIVSVMAWEAAGAARATITTSTGGVPEPPPADSVPDPPPADSVPDPYLSYGIKKPKGEPKFVKFDVFLADQFQAGMFTVEKRDSLSNPVDKNGEGISDPDTHLVGYKVKQFKPRGAPKKPKEPIEGIEIRDQFFPDGIVVNVDDINKADRLLVPASKSLTEPPAPLGGHNVDHYLCYKAKLPKGAEFPEDIQIELTDQFIDPDGIGVTQWFDLKKPKRLCNPVDKNDEGIKHEENHLMCYGVKRPKGDPKQEQPLVYLHDQFGGVEEWETKKEKELCVPAEKTLR